MVTRQEASDMRDAIRQLEQAEATTAQAQNDANMAVAVTWWNGIKPPIPQTRAEALTAFNTIKQLLTSETDNFRLALLRNKLELANEKFKERKRNG